jgi:hypothetical protein
LSRQGKTGSERRTVKVTRLTPERTSATEFFRRPQAHPANIASTWRVVDDHQTLQGVRRRRSATEIYQEGTCFIPGLATRRRPQRSVLKRQHDIGLHGAARGPAEGFNCTLLSRFWFSMAFHPTKVFFSTISLKVSLAVSTPIKSVSSIDVPGVHMTVVTGANQGAKEND